MVPIPISSSFISTTGRSRTCIALRHRLTICCITYYATVVIKMPVYDESFCWVDTTSTPLVFRGRRYKLRYTSLGQAVPVGLEPTIIRLTAERITIMLQDISALDE